MQPYNLSYSTTLFFYDLELHVLYSISENLAPGHLKLNVIVRTLMKRQ